MRSAGAGRRGPERGGRGVGKPDGKAEGDARSVVRRSAERLATIGIANRDGRTAPIPRGRESYRAITGSSRLSRRILRDRAPAIVRLAAAVKCRSSA